LQYLFYPFAEDITKTRSDVMSRILSMATCVVVTTAVQLSAYCEAAAPPKQRMQVGRYQMVVGPHGYVYVIDTATGQCWNRSPDLRWTDMGKPWDPKPRPTPKKPLILKLPNEPVELTVLQRPPAKTLTPDVNRTRRVSVSCAELLNVRE
jgi:hypothetical protein